MKKIVFCFISFIFVIFALIFFINMLSWLPIEDIFIYYVFIIPLTLILFILITKIFIELQKPPTKVYKKISRLSNIIICLIVFCITFEFVFLNMSSNYQKLPNNKNYLYFNSENFFDYSENENTDYVEDAYISTFKIFDSNSTNVSKRISIDEKDCVLTIEVSNIDTRSIILPKLKYMLYKKEFFNQKNFCCDGIYIYYYDPGQFSNIVHNNKMTVMGISKGKFFFINIESTSSAIPIDEIKVLDYCKSQIDN